MIPFNATYKLPNHILNVINDKILNSVSPQQKKIGTIVLAIFVCLAVLYLICHRILKIKKENVQEAKIEKENVQDGKIKFSHGYVDLERQKIVLTENVDLQHLYIDPIKEALANFPKGSYAIYPSPSWWMRAYIFHDHDGKIDDFHIDPSHLELYESHSDFRVNPQERAEIEKIISIRKTFQKIEIEEIEGLHYQCLK